MTVGRLSLIEEIRRAANDLPLPLAESLAEAIEGMASPAAVGATNAIQGAVPQPHYRAAAFRLLDAWRQQTTGPFAHRMFDGDHFFIHTHEAALLAHLSADLAALVEQLEPLEAAPTR